MQFHLRYDAIRQGMLLELVYGHSVAPLLFVSDTFLGRDDSEIVTLLAELKNIAVSAYGPGVYVYEASHKVFDLINKLQQAHAAALETRRQRECTAPAGK